MGQADGVVTGLVLLAGDGQVGKRYNVVLVAEGYLASEAGLFEADAALVRNRMLGTAPFQQYAAHINVFRLDVASTEAGADRGNDTVKTFFDAAFATHPPQLLLVDDALVVATVADALRSGTHAGTAHKIIVLVNTPDHGGSGGVGCGIAVASRAHGVRTALHELGHLFGLVDEYDRYMPAPLGTPPSPPAAAGGSLWPNLSLSYKHGELPWRDLVDASTPLPTYGAGVTKATIGAFTVRESGGDAYRPQWQCCMRDDSDPFCKVCARHIAHALETPPP